jgi:hypothetical protein
VRLFGSSTQTNAAEAHARAQQVLTQLSQASDVTGSVGSSRAERRGDAEPRAERSRARQEVRAEARPKRLSQTPQLLDDETAGKAKTPAKHQRRIKEARAEPATTRSAASAERLAATDAKHAEWASLAPHAAASAPSPIPEPVGSRTGQKPALKSVSFDLASGIKTVFMTDGTVHEEPIDSSTASKLRTGPSGRLDQLP